MKLQFIGAPEDVDVAAWAKYFAGVRDNVKSSLDDMLAAYQTYKRIRESFGLPLVVSPGEGIPSAGAITRSLSQQALELASMADIGVRALDDALANRRKIGWDRATETFQIERLPTDASRIETPSGVPTLISNATNQPVQITGTLGLAPIVWVGLGVAGVVVTVGALYTVDTAMKSATTVIQTQAQKTITLKSMELVEKKAATPKEAKELATATYEAAADLARAEGEKAGLTPDTNKTIRTVAWVALGAGAIYLVSKFVPNREPRIVAA